MNQAAIAAASTTTDADLQQRLLNLTKAMCEQLSALVNAARSSSIAPQDQDLNAELINEQMKCTSRVCTHRSGFL